MNHHHQYDEDLSHNSFFRKFQVEHRIMLETAPLEGWTICIPRTGTISTESMMDPDVVLSHVLIPHDELPETRFTNFLGCDIKLFDQKLSLEDGSLEVDILFEEIVYTKDMMRYKVWCIDRPLFGIKSGGSVALQCIGSQQDAKDFLWNETKLKSIFRKVERACNSFVQVQQKRDNTDYETLKADARSLFENCLEILKMNRRVRDRCRYDAYFYKNLRVSLETFIMNQLHQFLFNAITVATIEEHESFNRLLRKLAADTQPRDLQIDPKFNDVVASMRGELLRIENYETAVEKFACLRRALSAVSKNASISMLSVDDLIPILVFVVIKSGMTHWVTTLKFLKDFVYNDDKPDQGPEGFILTTLEAALIYIKSLDENGLSTESLKQPDDEFQFESKENFLECLFTHIKLGNEEQVLNIFKRNSQHSEDNDSDDQMSTVRIELCHPLCDCEKCRLKVAESRPTVNTCNENGVAALHISAMHGQSKVLTLLLALGADYNQLDANNWTPLHYAAAYGHQSTLLLLVHAGADINAKTSDNSLPLHLCAANGHEGCVKAILYYADHMRVRVEKNAQTKYGDTALHLAAKWGFIVIVESLLEYGVKTDVLNRAGVSAVAKCHNSKIADIIKDAAQTFVTNNDNVIESIKISPGQEQFKGWLNDGKEIKINKAVSSILNGDPQLALHFLGISSGVSSQLFDAKCHPMCKCMQCPTTEAQCSNGNDRQEQTTKKFGTLTRKQVDLSALNCNGMTVLHAAVDVRNIDLIRTLLREGAKPHVCNSAGQTPLHLACIKDQTEVVKLLLSQSLVDIVDIQDKSGDTCLHLATWNGNCKIVETILSYEPNLQLKNEDGKTALDLATATMRLGVCKLILDAMATASGGNFSDAEL